MMKKYISFVALWVVASLTFVSCDTETDEEAGGTNIEKMCGYWDVQVDAVDESGNVVIEDPFGLGTVDHFTYNTASNSTTEMWLDDRDNFWEYKFKVDIDAAAGTFSASAREYANGAEATATVTDGKILYNAGKNIHGMPCDSIVYYISFSDDENPAKYGYAKYRVSGVRHSGFTE